jgi:hypothetical protein
MGQSTAMPSLALASKSFSLHRCVHLAQVKYFPPTWYPLIQSKGFVCMYVWMLFILYKKMLA